jgi:protein ImuA
MIVPLHQRFKGQRPALAALKAELRRLEGAGRREQEVLPIGVAALEQVLPGGGLAQGALHEIMAAEGDRAAAEGFAASLLAGLAGPVLWCCPGDSAVGAPYGPGLARFGLTPDRLILVRAPRDADLLWAMEEGLRTPGLAAVLGAPRRLDLTASRRLQLAAESAGVTCLVLRRAEPGSSVAVTRWLVAPAPSGPAFDTDGRDFGLARARWRVELLRCRGADWAVVGKQGGGQGVWLMEEGDVSSGAVAVAQPLADRSAASAPERRRARAG